eukprot:TRINITY_DN40443_c0_g1_i1.p1 TRINITY_DN40443_c0_g1~~TRINITY_DN40443_c0_g1_i1.p1  ORF type:complete len:438 (-),score=69.91 TRINITY_DN40443_c0_g1_i1:197-1510(-)
MICLDPYSSYAAVPQDDDEYGRRFKAYHDSGMALHLQSTQTASTYRIQDGSVYGAALVMPQLARTSGWSLHYTVFAMKSYLFLATNIFMQGYMLFMLSKEERVVNKFGGQMHLCNFGAHVADCPEAPNCAGPGGTIYAPSRMYNWELWAGRKYLKECLLALFPELILDIEDKVDPGEYGLESYALRLICCWIFLIGIWPDFLNSIELFDVLWVTPNRADPWIIYDRKGAAKAAEDADPLDFIRFRVAGTPVYWKIINLLVVIIPKFYLWLLTVDAGIVFLMETAGIEDMVENTVALAFILNLDEAMYQSLNSDASRQMLASLEPFSKIEPGWHRVSEEDMFEKHQKNRDWNIFSSTLYKLSTPIRFFSVVTTLLFFQVKYYLEHCLFLDDGSWVSKDVTLPATSNLPILSFLFGPFPSLFQTQQTDRVLWTMPTQAN